MNKGATLERYKEVGDSIAADFYDTLANQAKKAACNMLLSFGDDVCISAAGFVSAVVNAHEAALLWAVSEGHAVLGESALADEEELRARDEKREAREQAGATELHSVPRGSAYI